MKPKKSIVKIFVITILFIFVEMFFVYKNSYALEEYKIKEFFPLDQKAIDAMKDVQIDQETIKKAQEIEENQNTNLLATRAATNTTDINLGKAYSNYKAIYVENDKQNIYILTDSRGSNTDNTSYYAYFKIMKQNVETNETKTIITKGKQTTTSNEKAMYPVAYYVFENMIYLECVEYNDSIQQYEKVQVIGFDTKTGTIRFDKEFAVTIGVNDKYPSFAVDSEQRFYFVNDYEQIKVYNNQAKLIYHFNKANTGTNEIIINSVSPNDNVLLFSVNGTRNSPYRKLVYQGVQKLNEGKFVFQDAYVVIQANQQDPVWHFLDNEYAVSQYGEIVKFNFNASNQTGITMQTIENCNKYQYDTYASLPKKGKLFAQIGNRLYVIGANNKIYVYDKNNNYKYIGSIEGILDEDEDILNVENIETVNNQAYIYYIKNGNRYLKKVNLSNEQITDKKTITYSNHSSTKHTQDEIEQKFEKTNLFDYTKNIYDVQPNYQAPYKEGTLKQGVITDTLNRINFYRWLYGVDEVTLNTNRMARNQKGALIQKVTNELTHTPSKPEGMSDAFYQEAYDGCNAKYQEGDTYSGNCAFNYQPLNIHIDGYVDDINNVHFAGYNDAVGHRWSILDPYAYATSFGYCSPYSTVSMYFDDTNTDAITEDFYAYPTAGNFPKRLFKTNEKWSFYFVKKSTLTSNFKVEFIYNGKTYQATNVATEITTPAITFNMPSELVNLLGGSGKTMPEAKITVKISGVKDEDLNDNIYTYDVNFFSMKNDLLKGDVNYDGKVRLYDALQILKQSILGGNLSDEMLYIMDYNDDGRVKLYDALKFLQQAILG